MDDEKARAELRELIDDHLGRQAARDVGLGAVVVGLAAIATAVIELSSGAAGWSAVREQLRRGTRDARAGLELGRTDPRVEALREFAERQLAFAALLDDEIVRITAGETTAP